MNASILHLIINRDFKTSPFLQNRFKSMEIFNLHAANHFSYLLRGNVLANLHKCKFQNFLSTPLFFSNAELVGKRFYAPIRIENQSILIEKCLFINCKSDNTTAGAIQVNPDGNCVDIIFSSFFGCYSEGYHGVINVCSSNFSMSKCCFRECYPSLYSSVIKLSSIDSNINGLLIDNDKYHETDHTMVSISSSKSSISYMNVTSQKASSIYYIIKSSSNFSYIHNSLINNVNCSCILESRHKELNIINLSMIQCSASIALFSLLGTSTVIQQSVIAFPQGNILDSDHTVIFSNCSFSIFNVSISVTLVNCNTSNDNPQTLTGVGFDFIDCYGKDILFNGYNISWNKVEFHMSFATYGFVVVFALIISIYFYMKNRAPPSQHVNVSDSDSIWSDEDKIEMALNEVNIDDPLDDEIKP